MHHHHNHTSGTAQRSSFLSNIYLRERQAHDLTSAHICTVFPPQQGTRRGATRLPSARSKQRRRIVREAGPNKNPEQRPFQRISERLDREENTSKRGPHPNTRGEDDHGKPLVVVVTSKCGFTRKPHPDKGGLPSSQPGLHNPRTQHALGMRIGVNLLTFRHGGGP